MRKKKQKKEKRNDIYSGFKLSWAKCEASRELIVGTWNIAFY